MKKENHSSTPYMQWIKGARPLLGRPLSRAHDSLQGWIQDLWKGGGRSGYRERRRREGFWRVPFEDPLWNFNGGGRAPHAAPPPLNPLVVYRFYIVSITRHDNLICNVGHLRSHNGNDLEMTVSFRFFCSLNPKIL